MAGGVGEGCVSFVFVGRPPSANKNVGTGGSVAQESMRELYQARGGRRWGQPCYGVAYYFVRDYDPRRDADADNVAKRLWDALEGVAYHDDHVLRLRIAGVVELGSAREPTILAEELDLDPLDPTLAAEPLRLIDGGTKRFLYVEIGAARASMFAFNLASGGRSA